MKYRASKTGQIKYNDRYISIDKDKEYNILDNGLINKLIREGYISKPRTYKKGRAYKSDKAQISMESHEQRYMRDKIKDLTKEKLIELYNETQKALDFNQREEGYWSDKVKKDKKEIIKIIVKEFAEINDRKKVNKIIAEALRASLKGSKDKGDERDGFKNLSQ